MSGDGDSTDGAVDAVISSFDTPDTTVSPGDSLESSVTVTNTGEKVHSFFVGYSVVAPDGNVFDNGGTTGTTVTLAPDEQTTVSVAWYVDSTVPNGFYDTIAAVWQEDSRDNLSTRLDGATNTDAIEVSGASNGDGTTIYLPERPESYPWHHTQHLEFESLGLSGDGIEGNGIDVSVDKRRLSETRFEVNVSVSKPADTLVDQIGTGRSQLLIMFNRDRVSVVGDEFTSQINGGTPSAIALGSALSSLVSFGTAGTVFGLVKAAVETLAEEVAAKAVTSSLSYDVPPDFQQGEDIDVIHIDFSTDSLPGTSPIDIEEYTFTATFEVDESVDRGTVDVLYDMRGYTTDLPNSNRITASYPALFEYRRNVEVPLTNQTDHETSLTATPDAWMLGDIYYGSTHDVSITIENVGQAGSSVAFAADQGISLSGTPDRLDPGESDSIDATLDASSYTGDPITIVHSDGELTIPVSTTIVDDSDLIEEDWDGIYDSHNCVWVVDVWGSNAGIGCDGQYSMDYVDQVSLDQEAITGFVEAELTVEFATDPNQESQPEPLDVDVNGSRVASLDSPSGGGEFETRSVPLSETDLQTGENDIVLTTAGRSEYQIGSETEFRYSYYEAPDLGLRFGDYPSVVDVGTMFSLPVIVENSGGRVAKDVELGISALDDPLTIEEWPAKFGPDVSRNLDPGELDTGYFVVSLDQETRATGEIAATADNVDGSDWPDRSFDVEVPNDPPLLDGKGVSPASVYPDEQVTYTASVSDPDDGSVDMTLEVSAPGVGSWTTMDTGTVAGTGTVDLTAVPFDSDDIGEVGQYRFGYEDEFGNAGRWGPFTGPEIADPNPEGPSFDAWTYPAAAEMSEPVEVSVDISSADGVATAELEYTHPDGSQGTEQMTSDGGTWSAKIPAPAAPEPGDEIEFVVRTQDAHEYPTTSESIPRSVTKRLQSISAADETITVGGQADFIIDATLATTVILDGLWTDWEVVDYDGDSPTEPATIDGRKAELHYEDTGRSVSPWFSIRPPERYREGDYLLTVIAENERESTKSEVVLAIREE